MDKIRNYDVSFAGLKLGNHTFEFDIQQAFFDLFTFEQEFKNPFLKAIVTLEKHSTFLNLHINIEGKIDLVCDITNRLFAQDIKGELPLVVKFGHELDDTGDEVWVIPFNQNSINVSQLIYELVLLSIPKKHIHPDLDSKEAIDALNLLDQYAPGFTNNNNSTEEENKTIDPRWDSLNNLLNNN